MERWKRGRYLYIFIYIYVSLPKKVATTMGFIWSARTKCRTDRKETKAPGIFRVARARILHLSAEPLSPLPFCNRVNSLF